MSQYDKLRDRLERASTRAGGGRATREERRKTVDKFVKWCMNENRQIRQIRNKDFRDYMQSRIDARKAPGTLQKEASHLRAVSKKITLTNQELKLPHRDRTGKKSPISGEEFDRRVEKLKDPGVRAGAKIQDACGLRMREVVEIGPSLPRIERDLEKGKNPLITLGTKGGRSRRIDPPDRERALAAVREAREVAHSHRSGQLIEGRGGDLESAAKKYDNHMRRQGGFTGVNSSHSMRYAHARELRDHYLAEGMNEREARAAVALDLGHGSGRGRYVASVYLRDGGD